jgi:Skp family chaperone for outer membrane proteins
MRSRVVVHVVACSIAVLMLAGGCQKTRDSKPAVSAELSAAGSVAVIDLDAVAQQVGRNAEMAELLKQSETALNEQLQAAQKSYQDQIHAKREEYGERPTDEQLHQLAQLQRQANLNLNQARNQAESDLRIQRTQLINRFREEVKPVARAVAAERGLSIVVTKNDTVVFTYESSVDITAAVGEALAQAMAGGRGAEIAQQPSEGATRR